MLSTLFSSRSALITRVLLVAVRLVVLAVSVP
jgi:hypothetical protein